MSDDPIPNPHPEFMDEVFEDYLEDGLTLAGLRGSQAGEYEV